jgi:hypothetical protein
VVQYEVVLEGQTEPILPSELEDGQLAVVESPDNVNRLVVLRDDNLLIDLTEGGHWDTEQADDLFRVRPLMKGQRVILVAK